MILALTRCPAPSLTECELTFLEREPIEYERALAQHAAYVGALRSAGAQVTVLPATDAYPDSVFVEDAAVVLDEVAILTRPGVASRAAEPDLLAPPLGRYRPLARIEAPATLEGGDVLRVGRRLFVGLSPRTNAAGAEALRALAAPHGYTVTAVPVRDCLHLKTGVTALDDEALLANPAWVDLERFAGFDVIPVAAEEPWAANTLRLDATLLANAAFPRTLEQLARRGLAPIPVEIGEFGKAEAGLTCLSLLVTGA
jgi:dimethylargininase